MEVFELTVDNKVEVWRRDIVKVEAENLEEAITYAEAGEYDDVIGSEYLSDTETYLRPKDVDGFMTCEIMDASGKTLWHNGDR